MHSFIRRANLRRYRGLLVKTTDETVRSRLFKLIAQEERRQILQERDWSLLSTQLTRRDITGTSTPTETTSANSVKQT